MRKSIALLLVLMMVLVAVACTPQDTNPSPTTDAGQATPAATEAVSETPGEVVSTNTDPILVGVYGPLSGNSAMVGQSLVDGVQLCVDQVNANGGVYGRMIELVIEDDEQDPATAVSAVNKLVYDDKVMAVIGTVNSSCTLASMEVTWAAKIPHITPISSGAAVTLQGDPYMVRIQASDMLQAGGITEYAINELGAKRIACLYQSDDYGTGAMEVIVETMAKYNMELVANEAFDPNALDMTPQLLKCQEADADAIIMYTMYGAGALIATQARQMGITAPLMGGGGLTNKKLYELAGENAVGIINTQTFFADAEAVNQVSADFITAFQAKFSRMPDSNNAMAYDAVLALVAGLKYSIEQSGDVDSDLVMEGMHLIKDMDMATGSITINENGDAVRAEILKVRLIEGGAYELVR